MNNSAVSQQLQDMIRSLDVFDDTVNAEIVKALDTGAGMIQAEQKRRAPSSSIAADIDRSPVIVARTGRYYVSTGYWPRRNPHAIAGIIKEFGRGNEGQKQQVSKKGPREGKRIGRIQKQPHIRTGFDAAVDGAFSETISALDRAIQQYRR